MANVTNNVDANAKTGYNDAGWNTGATTVVSTGDASSNVSVATKANTNIAHVGGSAGNSSADFVIVGNGAYSDNFINADLTKNSKIAQDNVANITNNVDANAKTGGNDAEFNTNGLVVIDTGNADASVAVDNMVNFNVADVDCGCTWDVLAKIEGNGADAPYYNHGHGENMPWWMLFHKKKSGDNVINLDLASNQAYLQDNVANLYNNADANAKTGYNEAGWNGGGSNSDPVVMTGDAYDNVTVGNAGNTNVIGSPMFDLPQFNWDWNMNFGNQLSAFFGYMSLMLG